MSLSNVAIFMGVRNEEERIENSLKTFTWADEIYVIDKSSTDNTVNIAKKYATKVIVVENSNEKRGDEFYKKISNAKWFLFLTASDLITFGLVSEILKITTNSEFDKDIVGLPFRHYSFGYYSSRSPLYNPTKYLLVRRSAAIVRKYIHGEVSSSSTKKHIIKTKDSSDAIYHLANPTVDHFIEKTRRYVQTEKSFGMQKNYRDSFLNIWKAIWHSFFRKKIFLNGYDGFALAAASISYKLLTYLSIWEMQREKEGISSSAIYADLANKIVNEHDIANQKY